ncbi:hypothetical protein [Mycoplasma sp. P36-A1]|uniref:hypothetical protein n=1 Tax=Mycoplasma sp. P36-A1 TaxID=3252900 RepID=UPI003C307A34
MKKFLSVFSALVLAVILTACGGATADGSYAAADNNPSNGWQTVLTFDVADGKITNTKIDSVNLQSGTAKTKAELSKEGKYVLSPGNAGEMDVQYGVIADYINEHDGLTGIKFNDDNKTDAVAGATITFSELPQLIDDAKKHGVVEKGDLTDGVYYAKGTTADAQGYIPTLGYYVLNGKIIAANIDAFKTEGETTTWKSTDSKEEGKVDMGENEAPFNEQALAVSLYMTQNEGLKNVQLTEEGAANNITGATMVIEQYMTLFENAKLVK